MKMYKCIANILIRQFEPYLQKILDTRLSHCEFRFRHLAVTWSTFTALNLRTFFSTLCLSKLSRAESKRVAGKVTKELYFATRERITSNASFRECILILSLSLLSSLLRFLSRAEIPLFRLLVVGGPPRFLLFACFGLLSLPLLSLSSPTFPIVSKTPIKSTSTSTTLESLTKANHLFLFLVRKSVGNAFHDIETQETQIYGIYDVRTILYDQETRNSREKL